MKIDELITLLINFQKRHGRIEVEVNIPQVRPGDEGPARIKSIEHWENDNICLIEVE